MSKKSTAPCVDGVTGAQNIANLFSSKYESLLNKHASSSHTDLFSAIQSSLSSSTLNEISFTEDEVIDAISQLKCKKSGANMIPSELLKLSSSVIALPLSLFFTSLVRHGHMPQIIRDSLLVPIPKNNKDASLSANYRPIALPTTISKVLEWLILSEYSEFFTSSHLQFGFKSGSSTSLCTGLVKNIVSRYIHHGSSVFGCFLDASKAFDLVNHDILFHKLLVRGLPVVIVRFLLSWYGSQKCCVRWGSSYSDSFGVSSGVRQGSILSPFLFAVYLDGLLSELVECGVGCYWDNLFAGCLCYADDIVLLAPCPAALRMMLNICCDYASRHGLEFNTSKSQLICFRRSSRYTSSASIIMNGEPLTFSDEVCHLGHILTYNLHDKNDIIRATKDFNRKSNFVLSTFKNVDPSVKSFLIKSFCLSLYGCNLWSLSSPNLNIIQVAVNRILRRIWKLPRQSHSAICHCLSEIPAINNLLLKRFLSLYSSAMSSSSPLVNSVYFSCSILPFTFTGYNYIYGSGHVKLYSNYDFHHASIIYGIRQSFGLNSSLESVIAKISCN